MVPKDVEWTAANSHASRAGKHKIESEALVGGGKGVVSWYVQDGKVGMNKRVKSRSPFNFGGGGNKYHSMDCLQNLYCQMLYFAAGCVQQPYEAVSA